MIRLVEHKLLDMTIFGDIDHIEKVARVCYRSEPRGNSGQFVRGLIKRKHLAMLEFARVCVVLRTSRPIANEIVRHRVASYAQESTRYVDYAKDSDLEVMVNRQWPVSDATMKAWEALELAYKDDRRNGVPAEIARRSLPFDLATTIVCDWNFREALHIIATRSQGKTGRPHPDMVNLISQVHSELAKRVPVVFGEEQP